MPKEITLSKTQNESGRKSSVDVVDSTPQTLKLNVFFNVFRHIVGSIFSNLDYRQFLLSEYTLDNMLPVLSNLFITALTIICGAAVLFCIVTFIVNILFKRALNRNKLIEEFIKVWVVINLTRFIV